MSVSGREIFLVPAEAYEQEDGSLYFFRDDSAVFVFTNRHDLDEVTWGNGGGSKCGSAMSIPPAAPSLGGLVGVVDRQMRTSATDMDEQTFCDLIDACFPYTNESRAVELINIGCGISAEAAFAIVGELAHPGSGAEAPASVRHRLLELVSQRLDHPAKSIVLPVARVMIDGGKISFLESMAAMRKLEEFTGMWSALSVLYFSCDLSCDLTSDEIDEAMNAEYERIRQQWIADS